MPEYILWIMGKSSSLDGAARRFPEVDRKAAVEKATKLIDELSQVLQTEHRFELLEVHFVPLPSDKWIINYGKAEPLVTQKKIVHP